MMVKKTLSRTLWTSSIEDWDHPLKNVELTGELERAIDDAVQKIDKQKVNDRVKPYDTPVTTKTLSKSVR